MSPGKVEQHYTEKDGEQALSGHARQRQHYTQRHEQNAADIFPDHLCSMQPRSRSRPELRFAAFAEMIGRQLDENPRDDAEVGEKTNKKNSGPEKYLAPGERDEKVR